MDIFERRRQRLLDILGEMSAVDLSERSGIAASLISRYKLPAGQPGVKRIGEMNARKLEHAAYKPEGWLDNRTLGTSEPTAPWAVAQDMSQPPKWNEIPVITWEQLVDHLPGKTFELPLRDDALGRDFPAGTRTVWETSRAIKPGRIVLFRDAHGRYCARMAQETSAPGRWRFVATAPGFAAFDAHEVEVLAVCGGVLFAKD